MTKFCQICKSYLVCNYCLKYGKNGIYIYLEKEKFKQKSCYVPDIDINKLQLMSLSKK